ncbi:MAG: ribosome maturation factor RimM [Nitrospirota bacterium]
MDQNETTEDVTIGIVVSAVGLRGEVKCALLTDFPDRFNGLSDVIIQPKVGEPYPARIDKVRFTLGFVFLFLAGVTSRQEATHLRGAKIQVPDSDRVALPADSFYQDDLVGLNVVTDSGMFLGQVCSIFETGGNDIYLVKQGEKEYLIPAIKSVVKQVDLLKKEMVISPMEGLLDL